MGNSLSQSSTKYDGHLCNSKSDDECQKDSQELLSLWTILPDVALLHICRYLSERDLVAFELVCRRWYDVVNYYDTWERRLQRNYRIWLTGYDSDEPDVSLPQLARRLTASQIICDPENLLTSRQLFKLYSCSPFLKNLHMTLQKPFRLLFFGFGLESAKCKRLSRVILCSRNSTFEVFGMFKGLERGIGCGTKVKYKGRHVLHFVTLYSNVKCVREKMVNNGNFECTLEKWTEPTIKESSDSDGESQTIGCRKLNSSLQRLLQTMDGLVYVVDSAVDDIDDIEIRKRLYRECLDIFTGNETCPTVPLLVLSCQENLQNGDSNHSCHREAESLNLTQLRIPWNVCAVDVQTTRGLEHGFDWLLFYMYMSEIASSKTK